MAAEEPHPLFDRLPGADAAVCAGIGAIIAVAMQATR